MPRGALTFKTGDFDRLLTRLRAAGLDVEHATYRLFKDRIEIVLASGSPIEVTTPELEQEEGDTTGWEGAKPW